MIKPFLHAIQFLTRIPVPLHEAPDPSLQGRAVLTYPLVGLLIGALLASLHFLFTDMQVGTSLQAALLLTFWIGITGALHIDGLADLTDAWIGGHGDRERTLEIMKDPTCGPMAVTAIVVLLLVKFTALEAIISFDYWPALLVAPLLGRASLVGALMALPYVRKEGLGHHASRHLSRRGGLVSLLLTVVFAAFLLNLYLLPLLAVLFLFFFLFYRELMNRIGGLTGDVAGALCELTEAISLATIALLIT